MSTKKDSRTILSANIHAYGGCNYHCNHCFATGLSKKCIPPSSWIPVLEYLKSQGITKVNIAGGEPTMYPDLLELCKIIGSMGFTVSIVSNGSMLTEEKIAELSEYVSWIGLSVDSPDDSDEILIGRHADGINHIENIIKVADIAHRYGIKVKLNITVVRHSWCKNFKDLIKKVNPERIKAFRALTLKNANDDRPDTWSITDEEYLTFVDAHKDVENMVFEDNEDMQGTYLMFDPLGRWMVNKDGVKRYLPFEKLVRDGFGSELDVDRYYGRNAVYDWGN